MSRANMLDECQHAQSMVSSYGSVVPPPIPNNPSVAAPPEVPVLINMPDTVLVKGTKLGDSARKLFEAFGSVKYFDMDPSRQAAIAVVREFVSLIMLV